MSRRTLRVFVDAPLDPQRESAWALFDSDDRLVEHGRGVASTWPQAERREAVIAADAVRVVALTLPPLPRDRLLAAATFALEERIATAPEDAVVALAPRAGNGRVVAIVASRDLASSLLQASPPFARAIAEPELASAGEGWRWCESADSAFVRTADGSAFAVSASSDPTLPPELSLALDREPRAPATVVVDRRTDASLLQRWTNETGVAFVAGTAWDWRAQPRAVFASATDVLASLARSPSTESMPSRPLWATAAVVVGCALALHVIAALATWGWQRIELGHLQRELVDVARSAGLPNATVDDAAAGVAALHATTRHRSGREAPGDAMPMLARAAPALAALPPGALRSATWSAGAWTLELASLDDTALSKLVASSRAAGLTTLHAKTASGVRMRLSMTP